MDVGDGVGELASRLVVARVEISVVDPHRVDARGRHEHRWREAMEAGHVDLVGRALDGSRRTAVRMARNHLMERRSVEAMRDEYVGNVRIVVTLAVGVDLAQ